MTRMSAREDAQLEARIVVAIGGAVVQADIEATPELIALSRDWRQCVTMFGGADSGPARGALLELVRFVWGDSMAASMRAGSSGKTWKVHGWADGDDGPCVFAYSNTSELEALTVALEAGP